MAKLTHLDHAQEDRVNKRWILGTLCICAGALVFTGCYLALVAAPIPDPLDRWINTIISLIAGALIKTGVDAITTKADPLPVVVENTAENPAKTHEVKKEFDGE